METGFHGITDPRASESCVSPVRAGDDRYSGVALVRRFARSEVNGYFLSVLSAGERAEREIPSLWVDGAV